MEKVFTFPAEQERAASLRTRMDEAPMSSFQWFSVIVCMLLNMFDGFDVLVMAFNAAAVSKEWHLNGSQLGVLLSAGLIGMACGSLFVAPWADKVGRKPLIVGCLMLSGATMIASSFADSQSQLAAFRALTGIGIGGILACSNVIAGEYASLRWRSLAVSLQSTGYALGATVGGSIAIWLLAHHGWRSVFMFGGVGTLLAVPLVLLFLPESLDFLLAKRPANALSRINRLAQRMHLAPITVLPEWTAADRPKANTLAGIFAPGVLRGTLLVWASFFLVMFGFYFVMSWTPKLLVSAGMTAQQGVTAGVLLSLGGIFGTAAVGVLAARFRIDRVLAVVMVITACLLSVFVSQVGNEHYAFLFALAIGVFVNACVGGLYAIAPIVYDASMRATGTGWGIGIGRIGAIVSPLIAGQLMDDGLRPAQLYSGYALVFVAAAAVVMLHRIRPPVDRPQPGFPGLNSERG